MTNGSFGSELWRRRSHHLLRRARNAAGLRVPPTMKPEMFCRKAAESTLVTQLDEVSALLGGLAEQHTVVAICRSDDGRERRIR